MKLKYKYPVDSDSIYGNNVSLDSNIELIQIETEPYEMFVNSQGLSFHLIFGSQEYGYFLCIPNWGVGCELADYSDIFWNAESIMKSTESISYDNAMAIVRGISFAVSKLISS